MVQKQSTGRHTDNNERQRLVAEVDLLNSGSPLIVAAMDTGSPTDGADDVVPIEFLNVMFSSRPLNSTMVITDGGTYNSFIVTSYDLTFYGHESSSEHEVAIHAGTSVLFVPAVSDN